MTILATVEGIHGIATCSIDNTSLYSLPECIYCTYFCNGTHTPFLVIWKALKPKRSSKMWWMEDDRNLDTPNSLTPFQSPASQYSSNHWPLHNIISTYMNVHDSTLWGTGFLASKFYVTLVLVSWPTSKFQKTWAFLFKSWSTSCLHGKEKVNRVIQRHGTPCIWACSTLVFSGNLTSWHYQNYMFPASTGLTFLGSLHFPTVSLFKTPSLKLWTLGISSERDP